MQHQKINIVTQAPVLFEARNRIRALIPRGAPLLKSKKINKLYENMGMNLECRENKWH